MSLTHEQKTALAHAFEAAMYAEVHTGCPAELSVAQWAVESAWGSHQPGNNCFGIKYYHEAHGLQMLDTVEVVRGAAVRERLAFASFPDLKACFEKHGNLIAHGAPYAKAFDAFRKDHDLVALIDRIAPIYATDPSYSHKLKAVLAMPEVAALFPKACEAKA